MCGYFNQMHAQLNDYTFSTGTMKFPVDNDMSMTRSWYWFQEWRVPQQFRGDPGAPMRDFTLEDYYPWLPKHVQFRGEVLWEGYSAWAALFRQYWVIPFMVPLLAMYVNQTLTRQVSRVYNLRPVLLVYNFLAFLLFLAIFWQYSGHLWVGYALNKDADYFVCRAGSAALEKSSSGLWVVAYAFTKMIVLVVDSVTAALRQRVLLRTYWVMQTIEIMALSMGIQYEASRIVVPITMMSLLDTINYFCYFWELVKSAPRVGREVMMLRIMTAISVLAFEALHMYRAGSDFCDNTGRLAWYMIGLFSVYLGMSMHLFHTRFYRPKGARRAGVSSPRNVTRQTNKKRD